MVVNERERLGKQGFGGRKKKREQMNDVICNIYADVRCMRWMAGTTQKDMKRTDEIKKKKKNKSPIK